MGIWNPFGKKMDAKIVNAQSDLSDLILYLYSCLKLLFDSFVCIEAS